jgi:hypothetical protein
MKPLGSHLFAQQDIWQSHLNDVFQSLGIEPGTTADNVSASVAAYCREFHPAGVQKNDLRLLIARAFCAIGEQSVAEVIVGSMDPHVRHVSRWLEILSELHHFPELLPYFSIGVIRPADWAGARLDRMWVLDFSRLSLTDAERHEIMLYRSIRTLIEKVYVFWDATLGEGVLGLKGLALFNVEAGGRSGQTLTASSDLVVFISDLFNRQISERNWNAVPTLLNLDL